MCTRITSFRIMSDESKIVHVKCVVLRARNLISKGKGGNNDVFVTIQLGKEKYQTSTIKNARNPEWFEECDLPIPHLHSEIEVSVYHRGVLSDDFLGYATLPLWEQKLSDQPQTQWVQLRQKPSKEADSKNRGEIEVKVTFHCHIRHDFTSGLKKRSTSLRNLASVVGDRLKFPRSKSFRENRKDPEGGKTGDRYTHLSSLQNIPEPSKQSAGRTGGKRRGRGGTPTPLSAVSFPALDLHPAWTGDTTEEGLTRSYSMSAAYAGTMSLDRGDTLTYTGNVSTETGQQRSLLAGDLRSQSMLDIVGNRHSLAELPSSQPPPPYQLRPSSHDDLNLLTSTATSHHHPHPHPHHPSPRRPASLPLSNPAADPVLRRERARYESIRERTEPETSSSTTSGEEEEEEPVRRPRRPPRLRTRPRPKSEEMTLESKDLAPPLDPESRSARGSRDGTPVLVGAEDGGGDKPRPEMMTNGSLRVGGSTGGGRGGPRHKSASSGDLNLGGDVRFRKRTKRERLRLYRQGNRRFTVQTMPDGRGGGLYDDSVSEPYSDYSKTEKTEDLFTVYNNLTKEELLRVVIQNKAQLIRKDQYIRDLESYIDNLLVRVMETQPRILHRPPLHPR